MIKTYNCFFVVFVFGQPRGHFLYIFQVGLFIPYLVSRAYIQAVVSVAIHKVLLYNGNVAPGIAGSYVTLIIFMEY